ncbi:helicase C-terminal domain-containing protein, partial [Agathobacter rectalis]|uniref:helicase C-terminal domain-containing protein n=1 Tax=Agathobacter rectalis TaxID=39491 RepID=UPI0027D22739
GIDLKNDRLIGAIVVGTGLPQISNERTILKDYYDAENGCGFDYAFRYPGINKVLQAAGRVIRTTEDTGVILLLDERFWQREYDLLYQREWSDRKPCNIAN